MNLLQVKNRKYIIYMVWLLCLLIIIIRIKSNVVHPQPWAEDGNIFITESLFNGGAALFKTYAGYYHLIPRIITLVSIKLSLLFGSGITLVPLFMNWFALIISVTCVVFICSSRFEWLAPLKYRVIIAVLIVLIPQSTSSEIFGTITNSQWWIAYFQFLIAWEIFHKRVFPSISIFIVLIITSLTGPLGIIPFLAMLINYLIDLKNNIRRLYGTLSLVIIGIGVLIQIVSSLKERVNLLNNGDTLHVLLVSFPRFFLGGVISRNVLINFQTVVNKDSFTSVVLVGFIMLIVIYQLYKFNLKFLVIPTSIMIFYFLLVYKGSPDIYSSYSVPFSNGGGRYLFLPTSIFLTVFIVGLNNKLKYNALSYLCLLIVCFILLTDINSFFAPKLNDMKWKETTKNYNIEGTSICEAIVNPGGNWKVKYPCKNEG